MNLIRFTSALIALCLATIARADYVWLPKKERTLEEAVKEICSAQGYTYTLPEYYRAKNDPREIRIDKNPPTEIYEALEYICHEHFLTIWVKDKHILFKNDARFIKKRMKPALVLSLIDKYIEENDVAIEGFRAEYLEEKFNRTLDDPSSIHGYWWHVVYKSERGSDGGINTYHFIVYSPGLIELVKDSSPFLRDDERKKIRNTKKLRKSTFIAGY